MAPSELFKSNIGDTLIDYDAWIVNRLYVDDIAKSIPVILAQATPIEMMQGRFYHPFTCNYTCYTERMPTFKLTPAWQDASTRFGGNDNVELGIKLHFEVMAVVGSFGRNDTTIYPDMVSDTVKFISHINTIQTYKGFVDYFLAKEFSLTNPKSKYTRAAYLFGRPLEGYKNEDDNPEKQNEQFYK